MDVELARLRLNRARETHSLIVRATNEYLFGELQRGCPNPDPYSIIPIQQDDDPRHYLFQIKINRPPPLILGILTGEFVHHLRATLDNLLYCCPGSRRIRSDNLVFPIYVDETEFTNQWKNRLSKIPPALRDLLVSHQPYHRWNEPDGDAEAHPLAAIRRISNTDKHRAPVASLMTLLHWKFGVSSGSPPLLTMAIGSVYDGDYICRADFSPCDPDIEVESEFLARVSLDEIGPISWTNLDVVLKECNEFVEHEIVDAFERLP